MNHVDELISASLSGDLTDAEREQMDAHLERCERCRDTLTAFADQRRLISGMRHVPVPRDLAPRIRTGIETGARPGVAWWRRPGGIIGIAASITTAAVAILLAVLIFRPNPNVSVLTSPSATASQQATPTAIPSESLAPTATPTAPPSVTPTPAIIDASQPLGYFSFKIANQQVELQFVRADGSKAAISLPAYGNPTDASLSPDGRWVAFRVDGELSGLSQYYAYRLDDGHLVDLGQTYMPAYGIGEELAWSPDSAQLAYTLVTPDTMRADVWLMDAATTETRQLTNTGTAYAASWANDSSLWISKPGAQPTSYLVSAYGEGVPQQFDPTNPAVNLATQPGAFEVLVAPDQQHAIFWRGVMGTPGGHWSFSEGGMPWLANIGADGSIDFANAAPIFSTLTGTKEMFQGASVEWGPDSDAFVVWDARWTGVPQGDRFPDSTRVYFGHVRTPGLITPAQALDVPDTAGAQTIVDVALSAGGDDLALTVQTGVGAEGGSYGPTAELRLVTRGYGTDPDKVKVIAADKAWFGPAVYPNATRQ
jgi:hypothetical protein